MSTSPPSRLSRRWQWRVTVQCWASPTVKSSCSQRITCPINVFSSLLPWWPTGLQPQELDHTSEASHGRNKTPFASCYKSYLDHTHTHTLWTWESLFFLIHSCSVFSFSLIDSVRFALILCFPGWRPGKTGGKSSTSSNSLRQTNVYFEKGGS